jgi:nitroimidazol reductase NimA-like FMN-containing flavoprotein (pyridoxamine 5'-phosphate oxidase superfamily)
MSTTHPSEPASDFVIDDDRCWSLLASTRVARVAFIDDGRPQLIVLNHVPQGHDVLFQTNEDSRLAALTTDDAHLAVAIEVDSASAAGHTGWSVVASGTLTRATAKGVDRLPVPWRADAVGVFLRLAIDQISGRHVGQTD